MEKQKCIIRGDRSGVFYGAIAARDGREVTIADCRRLWYWDGAATLSQLATEGTAAPQRCKFTVSVAELIILDAIEILPCTTAAAASIEAVKEWRV